VVNRFRCGHAAAADWQSAAQACLAQLGGGGGNLGFLYVTDFFAAALPDIHRHFAGATGVAHWVGTVGIGICASGVEYLDEPAIVAMIGEFPVDSFRVFGAVTSAAQIEAVDLPIRWAVMSRSRSACLPNAPRAAFWSAGWRVRAAPTRCSPMPWRRVECRGLLFPTR